MVIAGLVLVGAAALVHVFIFYLESFAWTSERARSTFGTTVAEAEATASLAFNQGFYNLFLAVVAAVGIGATAAGQTAVGAALVFAGAGSMAAAAIVLGLSDPTRRRAALKQGLIPLLGVIALAIGLAL
ncbi:DUF1304 domain-containing protein [Glycomyces salinus]|uniref:DUF1304 domain-containing protein n=1 Tax=Glycomyces salinus TaxID=980294 RepID=UPI0018ECFF89|nr:DUF1304 domain-containing protein [Glycomyces salinus]